MTSYDENPINEEEWNSLKTFLVANKNVSSMIQEPKLHIFQYENPTSREANYLQYYVETSRKKFQTRWTVALAEDISLLNYDKLNSLINDLLDHIYKQLAIKENLITGIMRDNDLEREDAEELLSVLQNKMVSLINKLSIKRLELLRESDF